MVTPLTNKQIAHASETVFDALGPSYLPDSPRASVITMVLSVHWILPYTFTFLPALQPVGSLLPLNCPPFSTPEVALSGDRQERSSPHFELIGYYFLLRNN